MSDSNSPFYIERYMIRYTFDIWELNLYLTEDCNITDKKHTSETCLRSHSSLSTIPWLKRRKPFRQTIDGIIKLLYLPVTCEVYEKIIREDNKDKYPLVSCPYGYNCVYAHTIRETLYHPMRYKVRMCYDGDKCTSRFCCYAHSAEEKRKWDENRDNLFRKAETDLNDGIKTSYTLLSIARSVQKHARELQEQVNRLDGRMPCDDKIITHLKETDELLLSCVDSMQDSMGKIRISAVEDVYSSYSPDNSFFASSSASTVVDAATTTDNNSTYTTFSTFNQQVDENISALSTEYTANDSKTCDNVSSPANENNFESVERRKARSRRNKKRSGTPQ